MNVSKQEFDTYKLEAGSSIERLHADVKSSYDSMMNFMINFQSHIDERFNALETKTDRIEKRLNHLIDDVSHFRSNVGARFDIVSGQLRLIDQEQFRIDDRQSSLEKRVSVLEDNAS